MFIIYYYYFRKIQYPSPCYATRSAVSSPHFIALLIQILDLWLGYYIVHNINPHIFLSTKTFFNFIFWYRYHVLQQYSGLSLVYFQDFSRLHKMMNNEYFSNFLFDNLFYQYEVSSPKHWFRLELYLFRVLIYALQISLVKLKIIKKPLSGHFQLLRTKHSCRSHLDMGMRISKMVVRFS